MLFEIIREISMFCNVSEEQWGEPIEFDDINQAVNHLKSDKDLFAGINSYEFCKIDEKNQCAYFTIPNRARYSGDKFIIQPVNLKIR